ncbi:hypothetical protein [Desulfovibrio litoralis]|uniref:Uncharacterized protein n=1 Tax=Desulfovibrio litoralis DSM 11393 TaxID=1121455 RepID=A0A1M7RY33_9BACT|nr:hypothetical protein [Desulfovibrio litoralis]SHN51080.1 hypothetical protein SAMN02745728_00316 [Desulfovibrio litoralis DSM 11393]
MTANKIYYGLMIVNLLFGEIILFNIKSDWLLHLSFSTSAIFIFTFFKKSIDHPQNKASECFFYGPIISCLIALCGFFLVFFGMSISDFSFHGVWALILHIFKNIFISLVGALLGSIFAGWFIAFFIVINTIGLFLYYKIMLKNSAHNHNKV